MNRLIRHGFLGWPSAQEQAHPTGRTPIRDPSRRGISARSISSQEQAAPLAVSHTGPCPQCDCDLPHDKACEKKPGEIEDQVDWSTETAILESLHDGRQ